MATDSPMEDAPPVTTDGRLQPPSAVEQWGRKALFDYSPIQNILEDDDDRETFNKAKISGRAFLERGHIEDFWRRDCGLPIGVSIELARLAQRIKDPTIEAKRIAKEEAKRIAEEERDELIKELHSRIQSVSCNVSEYCDPNHKQMLPFPFLLQVPERFKIDDKRCFEFYGRSKFRELYEVACSMNCDQNPRFFLHGTLGAGKSYLLAALACLLMRQGKIVVYVPDCSALLKNPLEYFRAALEFAYDSRERVRILLKALRQEVVENHIALERLSDFCNQRLKLETAFFIVDQANAFDDDTVPGFSNEKTKQIHNLLDASSAKHLKLEGSTANYKHAWANSKRQTPEKRIVLYSGLDEKEMEAWWTANEKKLTDRLRPKDSFQQPEKEYLEELTGRMPIFLQALATVQVENSSKGADIAINVNASSNISGFSTRLTLCHDALFKSTEVRTLTRNVTQFWTDHEQSLTAGLKYKYRDAVLACLTCDTVDISARELLDWRYFYVDDDERGHTTCGVVRLLAGALLRRVKKLSDFRDPVWQDRMVMSGKNPSVLGFHVEYLILHHIYRHGCLEAGPEFAETGREMEFHKDLPPSLESDFDGTILYRPASFDFPAVDGILAYRTKGEKKDKKGNQKGNKKRKKEGNLKGSTEGNQKGDDQETKKAVVVGIQITIAVGHSDSEELFFSRWKDWENHMKCENIEFRFLWIVENPQGPPEEKVPATTRELRGRTIEVPQFTRIIKTVKEVDGDIGDSLKRARELARK